MLLDSRKLVQPQVQRRNFRSHIDPSQCTFILQDERAASISTMSLKMVAVFSVLCIFGSKAGNHKLAFKNCGKYWHIFNAITYCRYTCSKYKDLYQRNSCIREVLFQRDVCIRGNGSIREQSTLESPCWTDLRWGKVFNHFAQRGYHRNALEFLSCPHQNEMSLLYNERTKLERYASTKSLVV